MNQGKSQRDVMTIAADCHHERQVSTEASEDPISPRIKSKDLIIPLTNINTLSQYLCIPIPLFLFSFISERIGYLRLGSFLLVLPVTRVLLSWHYFLPRKM